MYQAGRIIASFIPVVSAMVEGADPESIARYGILGAVLAWFMFRADKRLGGIEHKMTGLNRTLLIEILSRPGTSGIAKRAVREELRRVAPDLALDEEAEQPN